MVTKCEALLLETYGLEVPEVVEQTGNHDPDLVIGVVEGGITENLQKSEHSQ
jgi:hypothetical protein